MPRSNKKKHHNYPSVVPPYEEASIAQLLNEEKILMISRAIVSIFLYYLCTKYIFQIFQASAQRHGIKLKSGTSNPGIGDCAFEAIIQNINDRNCFRENFNMSIDYYRRIWATDMANRTVNTPLNTLTPKQWLEDWKQMQEPGAYERGIYGDLMLPGIACGVRKILLIFNTHPDTPHDPIYIVDPSEFNVNPDSEIPILLAYNMSHYESMEPLEEADIQATIDLVAEYKAGKYRYSRRYAQID